MDDILSAVDKIEKKLIGGESGWKSRAMLPRDEPLIRAWKAADAPMEYASRFPSVAPDTWIMYIPPGLADTVGELRERARDFGGLRDFCELSDGSWLFAGTLEAAVQPQEIRQAALTVPASAAG